MEEDANSFTNPHLIQQHYINAQLQANLTNRGKSCSHFFLKFVLVALFLCLLPLFPSEPPEFIRNTVLATTWELIYLLIIGIVLSYGLFCRPKTPQIPTKPQISQPYASSSILQHSSLFDYEEGNPSGVSDEAAIPTRSFNLSHYRTEPFVVSKRENCTNFNDQPLGLPVRSLRSRVVDSDSEEVEEVPASECHSDSNGSKSSGTSEEDEINLEGNVANSSPILGKSQSMRRDFSMAENGRFEGKQSNFESFRSPVPAASSCPKFPGFCSWLPESPNLDQESWRKNNFYMPFTNYNQVGIPPNLQNTGNFYMPPAAVHPSMPFPVGDFASNSSHFNHENQNWGNANFDNGNVNVENSGVFMPSTAVPPSTSIPAGKIATRSRRYNNKSEDWSKSPNLQNETLGGGRGSPNLVMPSVAFSPSMPNFTDDSTSSVKTLKNAKFNQVSSLKKKDDIRSENNTVASGRKNTDNFMPSDAFSPSMPQFANDSASAVKKSKNAKFNRVSSLKKKDEIRSQNNNVALGRENTCISIASAAFSPSTPAFVDDSASSIIASKNADFSHVSLLTKKDEIRSENVNVDLGREKTGISMPSASFSPSMLDFADDFTSFIKASKNAEFNHVSSLMKRDEIRSENSNVALGGQSKDIFMPSAAFSPSMHMPTDDYAPTVEASKNSKLNHVSTVKKRDEMKSENNVPLDDENKNISTPSTTFSPSMPASNNEFTSSVKSSESENFKHDSSLKKKDENHEISSKGNNVTEGIYQEATNSYTPRSDDLLSVGKSPMLENGDSGDGKLNFYKNKSEVPSVKSARTKLSHKDSARKNEERLKKEKTGSIGEINNFNTPHFPDSISFPSSRIDVPPHENRQILPEKWGDDCFVIPSPENNDVGDILLENLSLSLADSSKAHSSAGSSSRRSSHEQELPQDNVNEHVPWGAQMNNSEIEKVTDDTLGENDSYKPSTPSPPPRIQGRKYDYVASSVESSSRTLGNQSFLKDDDDHDNQGSLPTPERRKALSRASHSRRFSCGSFFDRDLRKSYKAEAKGENKKTKGDDEQFSRGGMCGWDCLKLDVKPALNKAALKGKSVRTIKPKGIAQDRHKNDHIELKYEEDNVGLAEANEGERSGEKSDMVVIKIGISEKRSNYSSQKGEKPQGNGGTTSILVGLNSKQNSNAATAVLDDVKDGNDGEIDRKADEFIAKFKEQIRSQKTAPRTASSRRHKNSL